MSYLISEYDEAKASTHLGTYEEFTEEDASKKLEDLTGMTHAECDEAIEFVLAEGSYEWEDAERRGHWIEVKRS